MFIDCVDEIDRGQQVSASATVGHVFACAYYSESEINVYIIKLCVSII